MLSAFILFNAQSKTFFRMDHFSRKNEVSELQAQRTSVQAIENKKVDSNLGLELNTTAIYSFINSDQFIAREEERDLAIDIRKFLVVYRESISSDLKMNVTLGVQPTDSFAPSSTTLSGPGVRATGYFWEKLKLSAGVYTIPSFRQFFINKASDGESAQLWSNEIKLLWPIGKEDKLILAMGHDYFYHLGPDISFQSGLRGNSSVGTQLNSEFLFDYSVTSLMSRYEKQLKQWKISPYLIYSKNLSAYDNEAFYSKIALDLTRESFQLDFAFLEIQKNAVISLYTPEYIDSSDIKGYELGLSFELRKNFTLSSRIAFFERLSNSDKQESFIIALTYRN